MRLPYRGDSLQASRDRVSSYWRRAGWRYAKRLGRFAAFGPGAVAAAGLANFFTRIPDMPRDMRLAKRARVGPSGEQAPTEYDVTSYLQYKRLAKAFAGRRMNPYSKIRTIVNSHVQEVVERWQAAGNPALGSYSTNGTVILGANPTADPEQADLPVYFFDVTSVLNDRGPNPGFQPMVCSRLRRGVDGNFVNTTNPGTGAGTGATNQWSVERAATQIFSAGDKTFLEWLDIRMVLYGARARSSTVFVEMWQFDDVRSAPQVYASNDGGVSFTPDTDSGHDQQTFNQFWNAKLDTMIGTGIAYRGLRTDTKGCRVLYSKRFEFNPTLSVETDTSGHMCKFNLKYDINKLCRYDWNNPFDVNTLTERLDDPNLFVATTRAKHTPHTHPKGRVFMVVRGNVMGISTVANPSPTDLFPSFDLVLRRKRSDLKL